MSSTAVWRPHPHVSGLRDASRIILEHSGSVTPITTTHRACFLLSWLNVTPNREVHRATQLRDLSSSEIITPFPSFFVHDNLMKITVIFPILSVGFKQKNPTFYTTEVCLSQSRTSRGVCKFDEVSECETFYRVKKNTKCDQYDSFVPRYTSSNLPPVALISGSGSGKISYPSPTIIILLRKIGARRGRKKHFVNQEIAISKGKHSKMMIFLAEARENFHGVFCVVKITQKNAVQNLPLIWPARKGREVLEVYSPIFFPDLIF